MMNTITEVLEQGVKAHTQGDLETAVSSYQSALELDKTNATAHNNLGFVYAQLEQWQQADYHLREAIRLDDAMAVAYANLGQVLAAEGKGDDAMKYLQQSVSLEPNNADHWNNLARVYFAAGDPENAEYAWHRALSLHPDSTEYMVKLATTMVAQKRFTEAHYLFDLAIEMDPVCQVAWAQKGVSLLLEQDYGSCKRCLMRALDLQSDDYISLKHLGLAYIACGETYQAIDVMQSLVTMFPEDMSVACDLAVMELSVGKKATACDRLRQLATNSDDSRILYYYAVSLKETNGERELIKDLLERVLKRGDDYCERAGNSLRSLQTYN